MSITKIKEVVLPALEKFWAKIQVQFDELNKKIDSFESTKSDIVSSGLGTALSLTASSTWAQIITNIKAIVTKVSGSTAISASGKWGIDTTNGAWVYIPANGYYTTPHWLNIPWATLKSSLGTAAAANVLSGYTFSSQNGLKVSGSMANRSSTIQTATTSTSNQAASCYRINGSNIEIVPAIGYWGTWDWSKSCIRVPLKTAITPDTMSWSINGFGHASENNNESIKISYTATENCYALGIILVNVNQNDPNGNIKMTTTGTTVYASNNAMYYGCRLLVAYLTKGQKISISGTYNTIWGQQGNMATIIVGK